MRKKRQPKSGKLVQGKFDESEFEELRKLRQQRLTGNEDSEQDDQLGVPYPELSPSEDTDEDEEE